MHNFLVKRPLSQDVSDQSGESAKKKLSQSSDTSKKVSSFSGMKEQCVRATTQSSQSSSACLHNPFSLTASKPAVNAAKSLPLKANSRKNSAPSVVLNNISSVSCPSTINKSSIQGSQKRKISSFFFTRGATIDDREDDSHVSRKKENMPIQVAHRIDCVGDKQFSLGDCTGHTPLHIMSTTLNSITSISICPTSRCQEDVSTDDTVLHDEEKQMSGSVDENCPDEVGLCQMPPTEQQEGAAEEFPNERMSRDNVKLFVPCLIPNLLSVSVDEQTGPARVTDRRAESLRTSGVIRNKISPFTQNAKDFSHSARFSLGLSPSRLASLIGSRMHAVAAPTADVELLNTPREVSYGTAATRKGGVTCVKFDREGVLCAVGGTNGVLRVYDFDEVSFALQLISNLDTTRSTAGEEGQGGERVARVHPAVHFTGPGRDISDICWLPSAGSPDDSSGGDEDEVAVAFTYTPSIHVYDLNSLDMTHCLVTQQDHADGSGNCCSMVLSSPLHTKSQFNSVVAGGGHGLMRLWKVPFAPSCGAGGGGGGSGARRREGGIKPAWEVLADPLTMSGAHCAVVSILQSRHAANIITTVTKQGVVVQWNLAKLSVQSFSASATPVSLRRIVINEPSLQGMYPIVGASFHRRGHGAVCTDESTPDQVGSRSAVQATPESLLCLTLSGGCVVMYDTDAQRSCEVVKCPRHALSSSLTATNRGDGNVTLDAPAAVHCPIAFAEVTGSQLFFSSSPNSGHVEVIRLGGSTASVKELPRDHACRQQLKMLQEQHLRYADAVSYLEHLRPAALVDPRGGEFERHMSQQMAAMCLSSRPMMTRCSTVRHTLQGCVLEATPGSHRVLTSQDMTFYLCGTGHENRSGAVVVDGHDAVAVDSTRRATTISGMLNGNKSSVVQIVLGSEGEEAVCYTIDAVYGCEIALDMPYRGPAITAGKPGAILRTNLQLKPPPSVHGTFSREASRAPVTAACGQVKDDQEESSGKCGERLACVALPARATAMHAHPSSALVVVGCLDDSVVVLSAEAS